MIKTVAVPADLRVEGDAAHLDTDRRRIAFRADGRDVSFAFPRDSDDPVAAVENAVKHLRHLAGQEGRTPGRESRGARQARRKLGRGRRAKRGSTPRSATRKEVIMKITVLTTSGAIVETIEAESLPAGDALLDAKGYRVVDWADESTIVVEQ